MGAIVFLLAKGVETTPRIGLLVTRVELAHIVRGSACDTSGGARAKPPRRRVTPAERVNRYLPFFQP